MGKKNKASLNKSAQSKTSTKQKESAETKKHVHDYIDDITFYRNPVV